MKGGGQFLDHHQNNNNMEDKTGVTFSLLWLPPA